jgi:hypothetical protein
LKKKPHFFLNGTQPQLFLKIEDDQKQVKVKTIIFLKMNDNFIFFLKGRQPQVFFNTEDDLKTNNLTKNNQKQTMVVAPLLVYSF